MKRSTLVMTLLSVVMLSGIFITDHLLAVQYSKINLTDPYKNFQSVMVKPFKALSIMGGNGYAISILQGKNYSIRLMNSRKEMFRMQVSGDTLLVNFTVANQHYQSPEASTVGLIITVPMLTYIKLSGTNNEIGPFTQDSIIIQQDKTTNTRMKEVKVGYLNFDGSEMSYIDFKKDNSANDLSIHLRDNAVANFHNISFKHIDPVLQDSAMVMLYRQAMERIR